MVVVRPSVDDRGPLGGGAARLKWVDPALPAELYRTNGKPVDGITIHRDVVPVDETLFIDRMPVTTAARTAFDLGRRPGRTLAVVRVDALANATGLRPDAVIARILGHAAA